MWADRRNGCRYWLCALLVVFGCVAAGSSVCAAQGVTRSQLEANLSEIAASQEYDEKTRGAVIDLLQHAIGHLDSTEAHRRAIAGYEASIASASRQTAVLRAEIDRLAVTPAKPSPASSDSAEAAAQALLEARAALLAKEADLAGMQARLAEEAERPSEARRELAEAMDELSRSGESAMVDGGAPVELPELAQARLWYREAAVIELSSRIQMLDQELISFGPRLELLRAQIDKQTLITTHLRQQVAALESQLRGRQQEEAASLLQKAEDSAREVEGLHPVLVGVARQNVEAGRELQRLARRIEKTGVQLVDAEREAGHVEENFQNIRQKLELAGMDRALGAVLQEQYTSLPQQRSLKIDLKRNEEAQAELALQQIAIDDRLKALRNRSEYSLRLLADFQVRARDAKDASALPPLNMAALDELLDLQSRIYQQLAASTTTYVTVLSEYSLTERRLINTVGEYRAYLAERLLWVRSLPTPDFFASLADLPGNLGSLLNVQDLRAVLDIILGPGPFSLVQWLGVLAALLLVLARPDLSRRMSEMNRLVGNPVKDNFKYTLQALAITMMLALPGPLLMVSLGLQLEVSDDPLPLAHALASALFNTAKNLFFLSLFYVICRPDGLAQGHFRWHQPALAPLRRELWRLMIVLLPIAAVTSLLFQLDSTGIAWGGIRLGLMAAMLVLAVFFLRVLSRKGELMQTLELPKGYVALVRLRRLWLWLVVLIPLCMLLLFMAGYVYTAALLLSNLVRSFWVLIIVVIVHQLCVRWLRITSTRLNNRLLMAEQARRLQAISQFDPDAEAGSGPPRQEVDVLSLSRDSLRLVNAVSTIVAVLGFALVWAPLLPALRVLDKITLWSVGTAGGAGFTTVTLADLGLALLLAGAAVFLYRKLPAILELMLMQFTSLTANKRVTAITLIRYLLVGLSIGVVVVKLGFQWSRFQWLAAALGVGIGFGLQEILANFISGLIILFERPVRVGDRVTIGQVEGIVMRVQIRATTILTWDRQELLVPNKSFITGPVLNWSLSDPISRLVVDVGVAYGSDVARAMALVGEVAEGEPKVLREPAPMITLECFGESTLQIRLRCYLDDLEARPMVRSRLYEGIHAALARAGITVAFPQRDVHFDADRPLQIVLEGR